MSNDLRSSLIPHKGELGRDREEVVREFLRRYLPKKFEITTGFAFDSSGAISDQLDIVIADSTIAPRFEGPGGTRLIPCESIVAAGQVKSVARSRGEFASALKNLESVKRLDRSAAGKAIDFQFGEAIDQKQNHLHQIFTFLLVTGKALNSDTVRDDVLEHVLETPAHVWTNVILALDQYLITFCCDAGVCPNPMDARGVAVQSADNADDLLLRFYIMLGGAAEVTRVSGLAYWEHLHATRKWSADVYFSLTDNPPPLLASLTRA